MQHTATICDQDNACWSTIDNNALQATDNHAFTTHSYFRSRGIVSDIGINPLIAAASTLFALVGKIVSLTKAPNYASLYDDLNHEIKAFQNNAQNHGIALQIIIAARYAICALIDEVIIQSGWDNCDKWQSMSLLKTYYRGDDQGERFFITIERTLQEREKHTDLLEFYYLCLRFGFEGKYRQQSSGHQTLGTVTERIYQSIRQHRKELPNKLSNINTRIIHKTTRHLAIWQIATITGTLLAAMFFSFKIHSDISFSKTTHQLNTAINQ